MQKEIAMTNSKARLALLSSVSTAAAIFLLPASAQAQATTCSQTGTTITCVDGTTTVLTATTDAATTTVPGPGLVTTNTTAPSTTNYVATGPIATTAVPGVTLTSTGGALTFTPSSGAPVNITTIGGTGANGLTLNTAGQAATVTVGNITTSGINSIGVLSTGGTDLTLRTGNITTTGGSTAPGNNAAGIFALNQTGNVLITAGNISTAFGDGLIALTSSTARNSVSVGNVTTSDVGLFVRGGTVSVTAGNVQSGGVGVAAVSNGAGSVTTNIGSITTTGAGATGLGIRAGTGAVDAGYGNITTSGIAAFGNSGSALDIASTGTINLRGSGATLRTNGAGVTAAIISGAGVTGNLGNIITTGLGAQGAVITSTAPVNLTVGTVTTTGNGLTVNASNNANVIVNATGNVTSATGTGITATTGGTTLVTIGAGTTTTGVQGVNLQGGAGNTLIVNGTLRNTGGTTPYTVLNGGPFTLTLASTGTIVGPLTFTTGNDTFNNQGTYALPATIDFLGGTNVLNNTGTLTAFTGTSTISNLQTFNNSGGLIDMRNGVATDRVNLANSNYVATGNALLGIDVVGTSGVNSADRLIIGGTTTGTTTVLANFINPVIDTTGALIVDSTLNNLTAGQFVLSGPTNFGLINYGIQLRGGDAFIASNLDARAYDVTFVGRQMRDLWYESADAYNSYATARRVSFGQERSHPLGIWAQLYGERQTTGDRNRTATAFGTSFAVQDRIRTEFRGAQGGLDFGAANFVIGITGGYERARATSDAASIITTEGYNYGAYAQFGMTTGLYAGALVKRDDYRTRLTNGSFQNGFATPRSHSTGVEGEIGFRTGGVDNINFDIGAGVAYVRSNMSTFDFGNINFTQDKMTSVRGRVHARATFAGPIAPFIEARGFHEFRDENDYVLRSGLSSTTLDGIGNGGKGTWVRLEAGIGGGSNGGPLLSAWANVGDTTGYGLRAGFRF